MYMPPMSIDDVGQKGFEELFIELRLHRAEVAAWTERTQRRCNRLSTRKSLPNKNLKNRMTELKMIKISEVNLRPEGNWLKKKR